MTPRFPLASGLFSFVSRPTLRLARFIPYLLIELAASASRLLIRWIDPERSRMAVSGTSNRQRPELELTVSHRKQRIGEFLIAKFRPNLRSIFCQTRPLNLPISLHSGPSSHVPPPTSLVLLEHFATRTKQTTSQFLIDNFRVLFLRQDSLPHAFAILTGPNMPDDESPLHATQALCLPSSCFAPTSNFEPQTSSSNRHIPELESELTYRKQRTGPHSNRHKFTIFNLPAFPLASLLKPEMEHLPCL
jgi:hypothetical protein